MHELFLVLKQYWIIVYHISNKFTVLKACAICTWHRCLTWAVIFCMFCYKWTNPLPDYFQRLIYWLISLPAKFFVVATWHNLSSIGHNPPIAIQGFLSSYTLSNLSDYNNVSMYCASYGNITCKPPFRFPFSLHICNNML